MINKLHQQPLRRSKMLLFAGVTAFSMLFSPAVASAQNKVVLFPITPIGEGVDESLLNDIINSLYGEIDTRRSFKMEDGVEHVTAAPATTAQPAVAPLDLGSPEGFLQAKKLLSQGQAATQRNRWEQAREALEDAIRLFEGNLTFMEDITDLEEAYFTLAVSYIRLGKENESSANLKKVLALNPGKVLDASKYPNYFRSIFEQERKTLQAQGQGGLTVSSAATGAKIYLDGKERAAVPSTITGLIPGQHVLRVVSGSQVWAGLINIKGKATITQDVPLAATAATATASGDQGPKGPFIVKAITENNFTPEAQNAAITNAAAAGARLALVGGVAAKDGSLLMPIFICDSEKKKCDRLMQAKLDMDLNALDVEAPRFADLLAQKALGINGDINGAVPFVVDEDSAAAVAAAPVVVPVVEPVAEPVATPEQPAIAPVTEATAEPAEEQPAVTAPETPAAPEPESEPAPVEEEEELELAVTNQPTEITNPDIMATAPVDLDQQAKNSGKKPVYKQAWFWTVTGIVIVGAATGITLGVMGHQGKLSDNTTIRMVW